MTTLKHEERNNANNHLSAEGYAQENGAGQDRVHEEAHRPIPEGLSEHQPGESIGEWLRNDLEQTKEDLHFARKKG